MGRKYNQIKLPKWKFQSFRYLCELLMLQGTTKLYMVLKATQFLKNTIIGVLMFFKCGKTNYMGEKHCACLLLITQSLRYLRFAG